MLAGLAGMANFLKLESDRPAFACSCLYIAGMLGGAAFALYPCMLPACGNPALSLTAYGTAATRYGLTVGLFWWTIGIVLTIGYFVFVYRAFRGKVQLN